MSGIILPEPPAALSPEPGSACEHAVAFDEEASRGLPAPEVRKRWPRHWGACPLGCGFNGIAYASFAHYIAGDW